MAHRIGRALLLEGFWHFRWFHAVMLWAGMGLLAWNSSPVLVYALGQPAPGTAPRYTGTIVVQGAPGASRSFRVVPDYVLRTESGDVHMHCGYLPRPRECWFRGNLGVLPRPDEVYEIGWHWYWGIDHIGYPPRLTDLMDYNAPEIIRERRLYHLRAHKGPAAAFIFLLTVYVTLATLALNFGQGSAPGSGSASPNGKSKHVEPESDVR